MVTGGKFTGRTFLKAVNVYVRSRGREKQGGGQKGKAAGKGAGGKLRLKELLKQGEVLDSIDLKDPEIKEFEKYARRYGVDYAIKRERKSGRYYIFFKSRDTGSMNTVFREYTAGLEKKQRRGEPGAEKGGKGRTPLAQRLSKARETLERLGKGSGPRSRENPPPAR